MMHVYLFRCQLGGPYVKKGVTKWKRHVVDVGSQIGAGSIECSMAKVSKLDQNRALM